MPVFIATTTIRSVIGEPTSRLDRIQDDEIESAAIPFAETLASSLPDEPLELRRDIGKVLNMRPTDSRDTSTAF